MNLEEFEEAEKIVRRMRYIKQLKLLTSEGTPTEVNIQFEFNKFYSITDSELLGDIMSLINDKCSVEYEELKKKMHSL